MNLVTQNPAEIAAQEALAHVIASVDEKKNFILEAGAGAGKTYSLIKALKHLIKHSGKKLLRENQLIACITYTNVAKDEIRSRIDGHPAVFVDTIHSFCWSLLKDFQPNLRSVLPSLGKWQERITEQGPIEGKRIVYELGFPKIEEDRVMLHHDDVLGLMEKLLELPKFRQILCARYPVIFIDEYQDTDKDVVESFKRHFLTTETGPLFGFFGDHWQQIYGSTCGKIENENLKVIGKKANFRSLNNIVQSLNRIRPELPQHPEDPQSAGDINVFHSNNWIGTRRTGGHWADDLPAEAAQKYLQHVRQVLTGQGWVFTPEKTKILMLTHNVLSEEQGYKNLAGVFSRTDSYIKKEDDYIAFFANKLEPAVESYVSKKYGEMFSYLETKKPLIVSHAKKNEWKQSMDRVCQIRSSGTIGDMLAHLQEKQLPKLPDKIEKKERNAAEIGLKPESERTEDETSILAKNAALKAVSYKEVIELTKYIEDKTPFATKHGVKGAEFENVLVVFGRGWNHYNFGQMLEWFNNGVPNGKHDTFERNRNLFYVVCSRPKVRLALLFTQKLNDDALAALGRFFGTGSIQALPDLQ